ncbi:hypothetical protein [Roseateles chitinivorans]|uniref:hypothetical protein n=1 Tax=Roseateles chitinivorans TaxID=2917965 RepID=UPI003D675D67
MRGYDIELWAVRDHAAGSNVAGLFRLVDGDCDKAPRPIFNGRLNRKTGELTFEVPVSESPVLSTGTFKGAMTDRTLAGTLTLANGNTEAGRTQAMTIKIDRKQN